MAAYRRVDDLRSHAGWLPVHRDQLRAQRLVSSMGSLYLYLFYMLTHQTAPKGVVTIVCQSEIGKMVERSEWSGYLQSDQSQRTNVVSAHQSQITKWGHPALAYCLSVLCKLVGWNLTSLFSTNLYQRQYVMQVICYGIEQMNFHSQNLLRSIVFGYFSVFFCQWRPSCRLQFLVSSALLTVDRVVVSSAGPHANHLHLVPDR